MYILAKNKKTIVAFGANEVGVLTIQKSIGGKFCIVCGEVGSIVLSTYAEEKLAMDELSKIFSAIEDGKNFYEMS